MPRDIEALLVPLGVSRMRLAGIRCSVGAGKQTRLVAQRIVHHGRQVRVRDRDAAHAATVDAISLFFVQADATEVAAWRESQMHNIQSVAAMMGFRLDDVAY